MSDSGLVEVGLATAALRGEPESGDLHLVTPFPGGVLVAAIDGLGHGPAAAHAARMAGSQLHHDAGAPLTTLFERCHKRLTKTRGVVMSAAAFDAAGQAMTWLGVGNVEGVLVRAEGERGAARESILLVGGVLGYQLPHLRATTIPVFPGDTLVFATDGVSSGFAQGLQAPLSAQQLADNTLSEHGRDTDDALVLVARFKGNGG